MHIIGLRLRLDEQLLGNVMAGGGAEMAPLSTTLCLFLGSVALSASSH